MRVTSLRAIGARRRACDRCLTPAARVAAPSCGTDPVVLNAYFETGFPLPTRLAEEFTKQFPNVTFDIKEDQFTNLMENSPRVLAGDNAPDLIRLPSISDLVVDGLLEEHGRLLHRVRLGQVPRLAARPAARQRRAAVRAAKARSMRWASTTA